MENVGATSIEQMLVVCFGPTPDPALEVVQDYAVRLISPQMCLGTGRVILASRIFGALHACRSFQEPTPPSDLLSLLQ